MAPPRLDLLGRGSEKSAGEIVPTQSEVLTANQGPWPILQSRLQEYLTPESYGNWIQPLQFRGLLQGSICLTAPNPDVQDWVQSEGMAPILDAAADVGLSIRSVTVDVEAPIYEQLDLPSNFSAPADALRGARRSGIGDIAFLHSFLAQVGLPRKRLVNPDGTKILRYERRSGNCVLLVQAGEINNGKEFILQPIPYGPKPRLMLMDICTRAVQTRSPDVDLGPSVRQYLTKRLGVGWGGGRNGQYTIFRKQALALSACSIRLAAGWDGRVVQFQGMPISRFEAWVQNEGHQQPLWPGRLTLSDEFYGSLIDHGLPVDMRAYHALSHSALAMDLYTFLSHRLWRISESIEISWEQMRAAMAPEYAEIRNFRRDFLKALRDVQEVYSGSKGCVQPIRGRVRLSQGKPPVEPTAPRRSRNR